MNALKIFLSAFWPAFLGGAVFLSLFWLVKTSIASGYPPFVGPNSFSELSPFSEAEQKRLLQEASREAFGGWRWLIPICLFAAVFASGVALGYMLPLVTSFPNSIWAWTGLGIVFAGLGGWAASRLEKYSIAPALKRRIASVNAPGSGTDTK